MAFRKEEDSSMICYFENGILISRDASNVNGFVLRGGIEPTYPIEWFKAHPGQKPQQNISIYAGTYDNWVRVVTEKVKAGTLEVKEARTFLYLSLPLVTGKLNDDWQSYGIKIGSENDLITPGTLATITINTEIKDPTSTVVTAPNIFAVLTLVLGYGRYNHAKGSETSKASMWSRIRTVATAYDQSFSGVPAPSPFRLFESDSDLLFLYSIYDMFFNKFATHEGAKSRVSSLWVRHKDCAALTTLFDLTERWGLQSYVETSHWIFSSAAFEECEKMLQSDDEIRDLYSYFPYASGLHIVTKSYFSASTCKNFFNWAHITGTLENVERSRNAVWLEGTDLVNNVRTALLASFALSGVSKRTVADGRCPPPPNTAIPADWIKWWANCGNRPSDEMKRHFKEVKENLTNPKKGTNGSYVKNYSLPHY